MKIAKTGAALGLAALTLASSLSTGAAAGAVSTTDPQAAKAQKGVRLVFHRGATQFDYLFKNGSYTQAGTADSLATALSKTASFPIKARKSGWFQLQDVSVTGACLGIGNANGALTGVNCDTAASWIRATDSVLQFEKYPSTKVTGKYGVWMATSNSTSSVSIPLVAGAADIGASYADTLSVDVYDRTAVVKGHSEPGAVVRVKGAETNKTTQADPTTGEWTTTVKGLALGENAFTAESFDENNVSLGKSPFTVDVPVTELGATVKSTSVYDGTAVVEVTGTPGLSLDYQAREVELDRDGKATVLVDGLTQGSNIVTFQQFEGGEQIGADLDHDVQVVVRDITAKAEFDSRGNDHDAVLSGTAEAKADIRVVDDNGLETTTTAGVDGSWSTPVPAPGAGLHTFEATQSIKGTDAGSYEVTLNYGAEVDITSPRADSNWAGGTLTMRGDGQYEAAVEITEKGSDTVVASTSGINNGTWSVRVPDVDGEHRHTFTATMRSQGNLTTTDTIVLNPDEDDAETARPLALTNPDAAQLAAGYIPDSAYTFRGTGTPGRLITVENFKGLRLGATIVDDKGVWAWTRSNMGTYNWSMNFVQDKGTPGEQTVALTGFKPDPDAGPVQVTNPTPAQIAAGYTANAAYTFEGTGTPGKTITVQNLKGLVLGTTTVADNGTWSWTRTNMGTYVWSLDFVQDAGTAGETTAPVRDFAPKA